MRNRFPKAAFLLVLWAVCHVSAGLAQEKSKPAGDKPIVGLIPKAPEGLKLDGKLDEWDAAFVAPVHVGHPFFVNRGGHVLFLWDDDSLYIGLRCLDQNPVHTGANDKLLDGDAVEFFVDTRRGDNLGAAEYRPGTLDMFWTPFTGSDLKPRTQVRDIPAFKSLKLQGAEVAGQTTPWGYTAEFKLPWANFPAFTPDVGEVIGIDCALYSSDKDKRVDLTFVYSSPAAARSPATLGRVKLVDKINPKDLASLGRALLPFSLAKSANYDWLYGTVCISPTIEKSVAKLEGRIVDDTGKVQKTFSSGRRTVEIVEGSGFGLWQQRWDLSGLPAGEYTVEFAALDKEGNAITQRKEKFLHNGASKSGASDGGPGPSKEPAPPKETDKPPPPKKSNEPPKKGNEPPKKSDEPPPPKKGNEPTPPKKADQPPPGKEGDKPSPPKKSGDKPDPDDLPKAEKR